MGKYFEFDDRDLRCHFSCDPTPNKARFTMHTHETYELYVFFSGKGIFRVEGSEYDLTPGDVILLRPAESHYIDIDPAYSYERLVIHFKGDLFRSIDPKSCFLQPFNDHMAGMLNHYSKQEFSPEVHSFIIPNMLSRSENQQLELISNLAVLLSEVHKIYNSRKREKNNDTLQQQIVRYVNSKITENVTLDSICARFYISKSQLCRMFKATTGSTVQNYISAKRLLKAKQLLTAGTPPVQVAMLCGYNDYSSFYRAFIRKYGISPKVGYLKSQE